MAAALMLSQGLVSPFYENLRFALPEMVVELIGPSVSTMKQFEKYNFQYERMPIEKKRRYLMAARDIVHGLKFFLTQYCMYGLGEAEESRAGALEEAMDAEVAAYDKYASGELQYAAVRMPGTIVDDRVLAFQDLFCSYQNAVGSERMCVLADLVSDAAHAVSSISVGFPKHPTNILGYYEHFTRAASCFDLIESVEYLYAKTVAIANKEDAVDNAEMVALFGRRIVYITHGIRKHKITGTGIDGKTKFALTADQQKRIDSILNKFRELYDSLVKTKQVDRKQWAIVGLRMIVWARAIFFRLRLFRPVRALNTSIADFNRQLTGLDNEYTVDYDLIEA